MNFHQHSWENLKHRRHVLADVFGGVTAKNVFVRLSKVCVSKIRTVSHRGGPGSVPGQYCQTLIEYIIVQSNTTFNSITLLFFLHLNFYYL